MQRLKGSPEHFEGRLDKEVRVYKLLEELKIPFERIDHKPLRTMEDCSLVDETLEAMICKNLFLQNAKRDAYYLLMIAGDKKFKSSEIAGQLHSSRLSFASAEDMEKYLDISPGAVSVMGLMNDKSNQVKLIVDEEVLNYEYLGCHPCVNTSSLRLKVKDVLEVFLKAVEHEPAFIKIKG